MTSSNNTAKGPIVNYYFCDDNFLAMRRRVGRDLGVLSA